jgi:hypothetical protein
MPCHITDGPDSPPEPKLCEDECHRWEHVWAKPTPASQYMLYWECTDCGEISDERPEGVPELKEDEL